MGLLIADLCAGENPTRVKSTEGWLAEEDLDLELAGGAELCRE